MPFPSTADLYTAALHLYNVYPTYDEFDIREIVEEKSGQRVSDEDFQTLKALYVRVQLQRGEFPEEVAEGSEGYGQAGDEPCLKFD